MKLVVLFAAVIAMLLPWDPSWKNRQSVLESRGRFGRLRASQCSQIYMLHFAGCWDQTQTIHVTGRTGNIH